jgi:general nucleoside transport system permease protein
MEDVIIAVLRRTLVAGTPLLLGTIGEIIAERSGILNLGIEGLMSVGAVAAFIVTLGSGNPWLGIAAAAVAAAVLALLHAWMSVSLRANQVVSGLALTMMGVGLASLAGKPFIGKPIPVRMEPIRIPVLGDIPFVGDVLFNQDVFFYGAIALGVAAWFFLVHTRSGIKVRSVGENPKAAEAQGVSVYGIRYACTVLGGAFAGLAGAYLPLAYSTSWIEGLVAGRGWIVIALTIFALWNPLRAFFGSFLFGGIFVLQYLLQPLGISASILAMLPYLTTLAVLVVDGISKDHRRLHAPAQLGEIFKKGER